MTAILKNYKIFRYIVIFKEFGEFEFQIGNVETLVVVANHKGDNLAVDFGDSDMLVILDDPFFELAIETIRELAFDQDGV